VTVARYRRCARGVTVHKTDCRTIRNGAGSAWNYADGMTADQILQVLARYPWLKPCKVCRPDASSDLGAPGGPS
jgi:hypothetical protein